METLNKLDESNQSFENVRSTYISMKVHVSLYHTKQEIEDVCE